MNQTTILMYHTLYEGHEEWSLLNDDEKPYAISVEEFNQQLDILEKYNILILDPTEIFIKKSIPENSNGVILTFDDGHNSFYVHAYKILKSRGYKSIFFITTDLIEVRDDFCSWDNLYSMVMDGFMVQSHGKTHDFFPDVDDSELINEFQESKKLLEKHTKNKVDLISFPGGRYNQREINVGLNNKFRLFFTSRVGTISNYKLKTGNIFCRVPIRHGMSINVFLKLCEGRRSVFWPRKIMYQVKLFLKLILGNRIYHVIYKKIFN